MKMLFRGFRHFCLRRPKGANGLITLCSSSGALGQSPPLKSRKEILERTLLYINKESIGYNYSNDDSSKKRPLLKHLSFFNFSFDYILDISPMFTLEFHKLSWVMVYCYG